jgi:hypothetical protein
MPDYDEQKIVTPVFHHNDMKPQAPIGTSWYTPPEAIMVVASGARVPRAERIL